MAIHIKLDTNAVQSLIDGNDEFRIDLQNCVKAEITKRLVHQNLSKIVSDISPDFVRSAVTDGQMTLLVKRVVSEKIIPHGHWMDKKYKLNPAETDKMKKAIDFEIETRLEKMRDQKLSAVMETQKNYWDKVSIEEKVNARADEYLEKLIDKVVIEKIQSRIEKIKETL